MRPHLFALCLAAAPGCTTLQAMFQRQPKPHVSFVAPPPADAPYEERRAAYDQLRPATERKALLFKTETPKRRDPTDPLRLADGTTVHYAADLAPLVPAESPTALAIEASEYHRKRQQQWTSAAIGTSAAASSGLSLGLVVFRRAEQEAQQNVGIGVALTSVIVGAISLAVCAPKARNEGESAQKATEDAFVNYDQALREQLGICQVDGRLVDCYGEETPPEVKESLLNRIRKRLKRDPAGEPASDPAP